MNEEEEMKKNKVFLWKNRNLPLSSNKIEISVNRDINLHFWINKIRVLDSSTHKFIQFLMKIKYGSYKINDKKFSLNDAYFKLQVPIQMDEKDNIYLSELSDIKPYGLSIKPLSTFEQIKFNNAIKYFFTHNAIYIHWLLKSASPAEIFNYAKYNDEVKQNPYMDRTTEKQQSIIRNNNDLSIAGWDMVIATSFDSMNKRIIKDNAFPKEMEYKEEDIIADIELSLKFKNWQLTGQGGGKNVTIQTEISNGSLSIVGKTKKNYEIDNAQKNFLTIQVVLTDFKTDIVKDETGNNDGVGHKLKIDPRENDEHDSVIIVKNNVHFKDDVNNMIFSYFEVACRNAFNENKFKTEIMQIFSFYQLDETSKNPGFQFLKPTAALYGTSVSSDGDLKKSLFAIQAISESKDIPKSQTPDLRLVEESKCNDAVAINKLVYMHHTFDKVKEWSGFAMPEDFSMEDENYIIFNNKRIKLMTYASDDDPTRRLRSDPWEGIAGYVEKRNWSLALVNNQLVLDITDLTFRHSDGTVLHVNYKSTSNISLVSGVDKLGRAYKNVVDVSPANDPILTFECTQEDWAITRDFILDFVMGLFCGVAFALIGGKIGSAIQKVLSKVASKVGNKIVIKFKDVMSQIAEVVGKNSDEVAASMKQAQARVKDFVKSIPAKMTPAFCANAVNKATTFAQWIWRYTTVNFGAILIGSALGSFAGTIGGQITTLMDNKNQQHLALNPSLDIMPKNIVNALRWPEQSEFSLKTAKLTGGIYLMGGNFE